MLNMGETQEVKKLIDSDNNIMWIGELPNDSQMLASAYAACDTLVLPSQFETPGIVALEAGLAGAKLVITSKGGTKEYFKDMANYVEPGSIDSIKKGIESSLSLPNSEKLSEFIKSNFLWGIIAEKTINVYQQYFGVK
jgi:glycosyltransferase involved in cell wall biosynthesis